MSNLTNLSMAQALGLWSDLEQALHGAHGYGGNTAEIYLYRLMPRCPTLELTRSGPRTGPLSKFAEEAFAQANASLYELLAHFQEQRHATIRVEGRKLGKWLRTAGYDHRVHVKVTARTHRTKAA